MISEVTILTIMLVGLLVLMIIPMIPPFTEWIHWDNAGLWLVSILAWLIAWVIVLMWTTI